MTRTKRPVAIAVAAAVLLAAVAAAASRVATGVDEAGATLPPDLQKSISSSRVDRSFEIDPEKTQEVLLDDGTKVFLVSGDGGDACIGLADGSAACGPASQVAAGRLFLITVAASGRPAEPSPIPSNDSTEATVYGFQPEDGAARASILGTDGQVLGSSEVVDGIYRVTITTDAHSRRMTQVRFDAASDTTPPPAAIELH